MKIDFKVERLVSCTTHDFSLLRTSLTCTEFRIIIQTNMEFRVSYIYNILYYYITSTGASGNNVPRRLLITIPLFPHTCLITTSTSNVCVSSVIIFKARFYMVQMTEQYVLGAGWLLVYTRYVHVISTTRYILVM